MVTGIRAKNQRGGSVQVDYLIEIQEIKPWPPFQSLSSLRLVLLQWENGDRSSGSTSPVVPSVGSGMGDGKIIFNETFRLPVTLSREFSAKGGADDTFQKNCLELNLYEPRRDKTVKGQLLGTAIIDLAEYGVLKETVTISSQMNCKRSFRNTVQPLLFIKVQPFDKHSFSSSSKGSLSKNAFSDKNDDELVSAMTNEESEVASSSDDNVPTHSSLTFSSSTFEATGGSPSRNKENASEAVKDITRRSSRLSDLSLDPEPAKLEQIQVSSRRSSIELLGLRSSADSHDNGKDGKASGKCRTWPVKAASTNGIFASLIEMKQGGDGEEESRKGHTNPVEDASSNIFLPDVIRMPMEYLDDPTSSSVGPGVSGDRPRHAKPVESLDSARSNSSRENQFMEVVKEIDFSEDACDGVRSIRKSERKDTMLVRREVRNGLSDSKLQQLEHKIKKLEGELRDAAAVEVSLYSIVAEHGSSTNKVHAPARRLSRPYLHACKQKSQATKASAAKSAVSGLVLVAKACGSDVPRLTFWLSNSVVLRAIISQATGVSQQPIWAARHIETIGGEKGHDKRSPMKWKESFPIKQDIKLGFAGKFDDWENPNAFTNALEKIEAWIFSRIVESVWWQSFTPHMQSASVKASEQNILGEQEQVNYSLDLWKKVFKDAYDKICPVGAGGHECGCLPVLARLVMEQCVSRLDVAMFNAVLRESTDEMPTDPVSDPISDPKVLPISAGKSSFGAGAQLKNAIGNWFRWLTDLFSVADDVCHEDQDERLESRASFRSFYHLNALSELMMLPKDMLLDRSIRKEVCPTFDASIIKKILKNFLPDEFCQDSIPAAVFETLDSEISQVDDEESIRSIAVTATPILYLPPAAETIAEFVKVGSDSKLRRSRSSVLRKSYTSDDELDELESPITSILINSTCTSSRSKTPNWKPREIEGPNTVRYQLLREIWKNED